MALRFTHKSCTNGYPLTTEIKISLHDCILHNSDASLSLYLLILQVRTAAINTLALLVMKILEQQFYGL